MAVAPTVQPTPMQDRQIIAPFDRVSQKCSVTIPIMRKASKTARAITKAMVFLAVLVMWSTA